MSELFGAPVDTLAVVLGVLLVVAFAVIGGLAVRHTVLMKLGVRNLTRRPGRSAIIVSGLMLGTMIIGSALGFGDIMANTVRSSVITTLGQTDEIVSARSGEAPDIATLGEGTAVRYLSADEADAVVAAARADPRRRRGGAGHQRGRRGPGHQQPDQRAPADALRHRPRVDVGVRRDHDRVRGQRRASTTWRRARPTSTTRPRTPSTPGPGDRIVVFVRGRQVAADRARHRPVRRHRLRQRRAADAVGAGPAAALRRRPGAARPGVQRRRRDQRGRPHRRGDVPAGADHRASWACGSSRSRATGSRRPTSRARRTSRCSRPSARSRSRPASCSSSWSS